MPPDDGHTDEPRSIQSLLTDNFFYFFLRLRKNRVQKVVAAINERFPEENIEQRARRLIAAQTPLSFLGGALAEVPMAIPGLGQALGLLGLFGGASILVRMHLYLILEIALLYGKDIEDEARVPEMVAVVMATGIAAGAPLLIRTMGANPLLALPAGGLTCAGAAQLIGESAIRFYSQGATEAASFPHLTALQ
jgi:hypothetical protein|uniref:Uncharacterized protein n=1 Tax=Desulfobacca acetoxidans TaxID=60893 RepID=A0A7V6A0R0_9BACT